MNITCRMGSSLNSATYVTLAKSRTFLKLVSSVTV